MVCKGPPLHILVISIPSNGSIQFLQIFSQILVMPELLQSQSPQTGQFNSYAEIVSDRGNILLTSQSPQTGQFNSYYLLEILQVLRDRSQSPQTGQFNSYSSGVKLFIKLMKVSIPSNGSIQFLHEELCNQEFSPIVSIPSNGSIQFLRRNND